MAAVFDLDRVAVEVGGREALREVSFSVAEGERVVLLGVNGCGKTTLLRLLDGLAFGVRGTVRYRDRLLDAASLDDAAFRRRFRGEVALLFQNVDAMLFNPTVADEIAFGPRQLGLAEPDRRTERWAETFGLTPLLGRPPFELSGGEKKRVAMAALLAVGPSVLLLDEATADLDPASSAFLVDLLAGLEGVTTVVATHGLGMASYLQPWSYFSILKAAFQPLKLGFATLLKHGRSGTQGFPGAFGVGAEAARHEQKPRWPP